MGIIRASVTRSLALPVVVAAWVTWPVLVTAQPAEEAPGALR
jgi:hypothetical protein